MIRDSDLAEYLSNDLFLEPLESQPTASAKPGITPGPKLSTPVTPEHPERSVQTGRSKHESDVLHLVMEVFEGARWTSRDEYKRAAAMRDRKGKKRYGRN